MEWITPKTDWAASTDESGKYTGDYFSGPSVLAGICESNAGSELSGISLCG